MQRRSIILSLLMATLCIGLLSISMAGQISDPVRGAAAKSIDIEKYRSGAVRRWAREIAKLDAKNKTETHPDNSILFVGSSSIRMWKEIETDIAPYHPIQRGYGGARWSDVAVFSERLISPHKFRAVVFFVGNDISGRDNDKSPEEVAGLFSYVLGKVREHNKNAHVFYVAVTPTQSRFAAWPRIKAANTAARAVCQRDDRTHFIGTESVFLDAKGEPRPELFLQDRLHLNKDGYIRWAAVIKSHLDSALDGAS